MRGVISPAPGRRLSWACLARLICTIGTEVKRSCGRHDKGTMFGCKSKRTALLRRSPRRCSLLVSPVILILMLIARVEHTSPSRYGSVGATGGVPALPHSHLSYRRKALFTHTHTPPFRRLIRSDTCPFLRRRCHQCCTGKVSCAGTETCIICKRTYITISMIKPTAILRGKNDISTVFGVCTAKWPSQKM